MSQKSPLTGWAFLFIVIFLGLVFLFPQLGAAEKVRSYLSTGNWYPEKAGELKKLLDGFAKKAAVPPVKGRVVGLMSPHAGLAYSGPCAMDAYKCLEKRESIQRVILLGASHRSAFSGACVGDFTDYSTPLGKIPVDTAVCRALSHEAGFQLDNQAQQYEHSLENQLPFLQKVLPAGSFKIIPVLFGQVEDRRFADFAAALNRYRDEKTVVIASSDMTHFGQNFNYTPFDQDIKNKLTELDQGILIKITGLDLNGYSAYHQKTGITMCGIVPVGVMLNMLKKDGCRGQLLTYYKSGDLNNDYRNSVSYASVVFYKEEKAEILKTSKGIQPGEKKMALSKEDKKQLLELARRTLQENLEKGKKAGEILQDFTAAEKFQEKTGVFVTLRKEGQLRGCIGSIVGQDPLCEGIVKNALNAALGDPRFLPVTKKELKEIDLEISVMTPLQKIGDYKKIRLGIDGVVIRKGFYQAVYLPQVATETGWDLDEFLGSLCMKAGLPGDAYRKGGMEFLIFQAEVFAEKE